MKLELRENMYCRTRGGAIGKIVSLEDVDEREYKLNGFYIGKDAIKKASYNIIDLIESGDYVNGYIVEEIKRGYDGKIWIDNGTRGYDEGGEYIIWKRNEDIKSIVTKEQFKNMEYRIGE